MKKALLYNYMFAGYSYDRLKLSAENSGAIFVLKL